MTDLAATGATVTDAATFCSDLSAGAGEPLAGTAPRTDHWLLVEVRGLWEADALDSPGLPPPARAALDRFLAAVPHSRVLLVRQAARRDRPGVRVFRVDGREGSESIVAWELAAPEELATLDLAGGLGGVPVDDPLLLVCTHGRRDACCARSGPGVVAALEQEVDPSWVWQSSHVGGHRFAANLVWLPHGIYLGRLDEGEMPALGDAVRAGRIRLAHLRGRASYPPAAQAAAAALYERLGVNFLGAVTLVAVEAGEADEAGGGDGATSVRLRAAGAEHLYRVRPEPAPALVVSCGGEPEPQVRLAATPV